MSASASPAAVALPPLPSFAIPIAAAHCTYTKQYCEENMYQLASDLMRRVPPQPLQSASASVSSASASASASSAAASSSTDASVSMLPAESLYTSLQEEQFFVVFMSNPFNELLLYKQKIGDPARDGMVCWDYHVVLVAKPRPADLAKLCTCGKAPVPVDLPDAASSCPCGAWIYDLDTTLPYPCPLRLYAKQALRAHLAPPRGPSMRRRRERLFRVVGARDFLANFASDRSHMLAPVEVIDALQPAAGARLEGQAHAASAGPAVDATRREVALEAQQREAERASWSSSAVADRLSSVSAAADPRMAQRQYLAPPPPYPPIQTAVSKNNLDEFRFFNFPDSGRGVVMTQAEFLDFCHVTC